MATIPEKTTLSPADRVLVLDQGSNEIVVVPVSAFCAFCQVEVSAPDLRPDYRFASFVAGSPVIQDQPVTITAVIENAGNMSTATNATLTWNPDLTNATVNPTTSTIPPLAVGETVTLTTQATFGDLGGELIGGTISGVSGETETSNNTAQISVTVEAAPPPPGPVDLVVDDIIFAPAAPDTDDPIQVSAVIRNAGGTAVPAGTIIGVGFRSPAGVNPPLAWSDTYNTGLSAGGTVTLAANGSPGGTPTFTLTSAGTYPIEAWVDDVDRLGATEPNKGNNIRIENLTVTAVAPTPFVDATPGTPTFSPSSPQTGNTVTITVNVQNLGNIPVNGGSCEFRVGSTLIATVALPAIAAGSSQNVSTTWTAGSAATYTISATLINVTGNAP